MGIFNTGNKTTIFNCNIFKNNIGVYLKNSYYSKKICCNNFSYNTKYGIFLEASCINRVYQNVFNNNEKGASFIDSYANLWDNEYLDKPYEN